MATSVRVISICCVYGCRTWSRSTREPAGHSAAVITSALDVDGDGRWDLFAGSGDDKLAKGALHRYDPITLQSLWSFKTDDNASSADPVLADIDDDGKVEGHQIG